MTVYSASENRRTQRGTAQSTTGSSYRLYIRYSKNIINDTRLKSKRAALE